MSNLIPPTAEYYLDEFDAERFWEHVNQNGGTPYKEDPLATATGQCWLWSGAKTEATYGRFRVFGEWRAAHRIAYLDCGGKLPDDLELDHLCRIHNCVNPTHLEPVTHAENMARGVNAKKTHCKQGHEFTESNTRLIKRDGLVIRNCIECRRIWARARYEKTKANAA